jgi:hypothetical protein
MDTALATWLIDALVVVGLAVALWLLLSLPLLWLKGALDAAGVYRFPSQVAKTARAFGVDGGALKRFFDHAEASMTRNGDQASVRVVLDERHEDLRQRLAATELTVREAVSSVQGMAGVGGGQDLLKEVKTLREQSRIVERLGFDEADDLDGIYTRREKARGQLVFLWIFAVTIALGNGALLNVLLSEITSMRIFGVLPMSYGIGVVIVVGEAMLGVGLYRFHRNRLMASVLCVLAVVATLFEAAAMSIFSVEFATSLRSAEVADARLQDYWMVLLAVVVTPLNVILGFMLEEARDQHAEVKGLVRLSDEIKACNRFVEDLPGRWTAIEQKARTAEAAIGRHQDVLGGQDDRLTGALDRLAAERQLLSTSILAARIEDWPNLVPGLAADARAAAVQNMLLAVVTLGALAIYAAGVGYLVSRAGAGAWPLPASAAIGASTAILLLVVGYLAFDRLRLVQGQDGRPQPMSSRSPTMMIAALLFAGCAAGLVWACVVLLGRWGVVAGVFVAALGGGLCFLGYGLERAGRGLVLIVSLLTAFVLAAVSTLVSVVRFALLWVLAAFAWTFGFIVQVLAQPAEAVLDWTRRRGGKASAVPAVERVE